MSQDALNIVLLENYIVLETRPFIEFNSENMLS